VNGRANGNADDHIYVVSVGQRDRFTRGWELFAPPPEMPAGNNPFANLDPETLKKSGQTQASAKPETFPSRRPLPKFNPAGFTKIFEKIRANLKSQILSFMDIIPCFLVISFVKIGNSSIVISLRKFRIYLDSPVVAINRLVIPARG